MTDPDRAHVYRVINWLVEATFDKYAKGTVEHGGHLPCKGGLFSEAEAEVIDLAVYLRSLREQLSAIHLALGDGHVQEATSALRLLLYGDPSDTLPGVVIQP